MSPPTVGLPIEGSIPSVLAALADPGRAVLVAPPGSGKTTVVPLHLVDQPWSGGRKIVVLEPRRLATRAAARRMASLTETRVGDLVGYVTRDDRRVGPETRIEVVTEGVLTRRLQRDPELADTACVVFDEVHERNLQTDLGLALALDVGDTLRPDLRLLVMSATLDADRVARLLGDRTPVVTGEARTYPVEVRWTPPPRRVRREDHIASVVHRAVETEPGDVLVFLPGMGEIRRVSERLAATGLPAEVRMLHGSLPPADQDAAIAPSTGPFPKVVLSTDIAESSLTVEGVRIVVDSGLARAPRFDPRTGMTRLRLIDISKDSADQRAGRAGRLGPGVAYRLWSKAEHAGRRRHVDPEISQVDLAGLALELAGWGTPDPAALPFLDQPPSRAFAEARRLLALLGAVTDTGQITALGRDMLALPLHPRLAHMVAGAGKDGYLACLIAALVDERDVLRGHPDEVPVDLAERLALLLDPSRRHPLAAGGSVRRVRRTADDLARRARVRHHRADPTRAGSVLALAFPDRLAVRRGGPGRFQLRTGTTAWIPATDPLATETFLVAADLDGRRKDARIRLAAAIDPDEVAERYADDVISHRHLRWEGDRLVERVRRQIGGLVLDEQRRRPSPGPATTAALLERLLRHDLADLSWTDAARSLRDRVRFLHHRLGDPWPDWSERTLAADLEEWLGPYLADATGLDAVRRLDLTSVLRAHLGHRLAAELDRLAPRRITVPSGRQVAVDYGGDGPSIAVRVQEVFGTWEHPEVAGRPVILHLLSPAGRPVQITSDLAGFWAGSWREVRREMAGRYPKHPWPVDPANAEPARG